LNQLILLLLTFILPLAIGVPIAISIGIYSIIGLIIAKIPLTYAVQTAYSSIDSFALIAIPMFMLSGALMGKSGLTEDLIEFSSTLVGKAIGGLAAVTIVACTLFGAISGSGPATTAAIGTLLIPGMVKQKYDKAFAGAITACSGGIAVVIPPSILMIMYGIIAEQSITALFIAGIIPGLILALFLYLAVYFVSKKRGYAAIIQERNIKTIIKAGLKAKWALLAPIIILGGIYSGVFTVTEASIVSVLYALFVGIFAYKRLIWQKIADSLIYSIRIGGTVMIVLITGRLLGRLITMNQVPQAVSQALLSFTQSPIILILLIDALLIFVGMWMESITQIIIFTPILLPVLINLGVNPIQFGVMFTIACEIGYETPPLGVNLFVASELTNVSIEGITKEALIFAFAEILALIIISLVPQITLFLPRLVGLTN